MKKKYISPIPRAFEQVATQIADFISLENYKIGSRFPTERKLSEWLEVSRSSIREGLRVLEILGFLDSKRGKGTFVAEPSPFIVPYQLIINQKISPKLLNDYYEVALMAAEKIIVLSLQQQNFVRVPSISKDYDFWNIFSHIIYELGQSLDNRHYVSLWYNTFGLLNQNQYFLDKKNNIDINTFIDAIEQKDEQALRKIFMHLAKV